MDDAQKNQQNPSSVPPPSIVPDVDTPVGSTQKEQGPVVSEVLKPTETAPEIATEVAPFMQPSQVQVPAHQIIKAAGENTPVTFEPSGIVKLPTVEEARQTLKKDKDIKEAGVWIAGETVREDDRTTVIRLSKELNELKEAA